MNRVPRNDPPERPGGRQVSAFGVLIAASVLVGTVVGIAMHQVSAGVVIGFAAGCAFAILATVIARR
jgi:hypothetical protein